MSGYVLYRAIQGRLKTVSLRRNIRVELECRSRGWFAKKGKLCFRDCRCVKRNQELRCKTRACIRRRYESELEQPNPNNSVFEFKKLERADGTTSRSSFFLVSPVDSSCGLKRSGPCAGTPSTFQWGAALAISAGSSHWLERIRRHGCPVCSGGRRRDPPFGGNRGCQDGSWQARTQSTLNDFIPSAWAV